MNFTTNIALLLSAIRPSLFARHYCFCGQPGFLLGTFFSVFLLYSRYKLTGEVREVEPLAKFSTLMCLISSGPGFGPQVIFFAIKMHKTAAFFYLKIPKFFSGRGHSLTPS